MNRRAIIFVAFIVLSAVMVFAASRYEITSAKADRSFEGKEWASAAALYELMLEMKPDTADVYARAIVAYDMIADTVATVELTQRAMNNSIAYSDVLDDVRATFYSISCGERYGIYLIRLWNHFQWMRRAIDHELLRHYTFRKDGPNMVKYANVMLSGLPESTEYRHILAEGYLFCGNTDRAIEEWQSILKIDSDNYDALVYIGIYMAQNGYIAEALPYLKSAYELRPTPYVAKLIDELTNSNIQ